MQPAARQHAQDHFALGDETPVSASDISIAHIAKRLDPRIVWIVDADKACQAALACCSVSQARPSSVIATKAPFAPLRRLIHPSTRASSQMVSRGHDERQASITSP
jgi:hypothetical protein